MQIENLNFFDKFGGNLNLDWNSTDEYWSGVIYMPNISTYLYDNENIFILEKVGSDWKFPTLLPGYKLEFKWVDNQFEDNIFLYDVEKDYDLNNYFINRKSSITVSYDDLVPSSGGASIDIKLPLQVNIAFSPNEEIKYESTLEVYLIDETSPNTKTLVAKIGFYGEGVDEDERFGVWARNFGIRFNKEDANILKDYDIKEAFPDWTQLNAARKTLLVNKENVYPYIGTYKGLNNFINLLGYKDTLHIKEYWNNINVRSSYRDKKIMVDITDYLDDGKIDNMNILDRNKNIKFGNQFRKTEMLALVYEFTRATDVYDDDGIPEVEETTEFSVDEMFYKLNQLKRKVKSEFLPLNVKIEDIIGEFIYFQKITIKFWKDDSKIFDFDLNELSSVQTYPDQNVDLTVRSLSPLLKRKFVNGSEFGLNTINVDGVSNPYENGQKYPPSHIQSMIDYIKQFYDNIKTERYPDLGKRLSWEDGDDPEKIIGAPIVLNINNDKFTFQSFRGVTFDDLASMGSFDPYYTLENIDFRNFYEITWKITKPGPNPYNWSMRGLVTDYYQIPHFLPYYGKYRVTAELHDFYGNTSVYSTFIEVQSDQIPQLIAVTRLEDKFDYTLSNLSNVRLIDFGTSPVYNPKVNVLDNESAIGLIDPDKNVLEWDRFYRNSYGTGQNLYSAEIWDSSSRTWVQYTDPTQSHSKKLYWGLGEGRIPIKLEDLKDMTLESLFFNRVSDYMWTSDFKAGFYIRNPHPGKEIQISLFSTYTLPQYSTLEELIEILNSSNHPGIKLFNYEILNGRASDGQYIIHAQANYLAKNMYHILVSEAGASPGSPSLNVTASSPGGSVDVDKYTFFTPREIYSEGLVEYLKSISPVFDEETLFLVSKTSDLLNGVVQDPSYWVSEKFWKFENDKQIGYLPTIMDQNSYNINDIKVYDSSFDTPENSIVSFNINNIDGKKEFIWTLRNIGLDEEVIKVKSVPFFVWKFKDLGLFELTCEVYDNKNNEYVRTISRHINVLNKKQYIKNIEKRLNRRKLDILN